MSGSEAKARLEALARSHGWRLTWAVNSWPSLGPKAKILVLDVWGGPKKRVGGASCTYFDDDQEAATDSLARLLLSDLSGSTEGPKDLGG